MMATKIGNTDSDNNKLPININPINMLIMPPTSHHAHPRGLFRPADTQREMMPAHTHSHPKI